MIRRARRLRRETRPVHRAIAALGIFNATNQHTFSAIFQTDMGTKGDAAGRRATVVKMILRYLARRPRA